MYDLIIVGGGAAGLTAALYSARYGIKTLVLSREFGGLAATADKIMNWPGEYEISGMDLMSRFQDQVKKNNVEMKFEGIKKIIKEENFKILTDSNEYLAKRILFATGTDHRKLKVKGEEEFYGKGVSYCATCDGPFFKNKKVAVVGGGNSALTAALLLNKYAEKVYIIYRKDKFFRAEKFWEQEVLNSNIECLFEEEVLEIRGSNFVNFLTLKSGKNLEIDGVFVEIGSDPITSVVKDLVELEDGHIKVDNRQETSLKGMYSAGDVTNNSNKFKQIITAASEGAIASNSIYEDLIKENN